MRFVEEYANFIKKQAEQSIAIDKMCFSEDDLKQRNAYYEQKIEDVNNVLQYTHRGTITVDECMLELSMIATGRKYRKPIVPAKKINIFDLIDTITNISL